MAAYTVVLSPNPDGAWAAYCPAMPGAAAQGESREAVLGEKMDLSIDDFLNEARK